MGLRAGKDVGYRQGWTVIINAKRLGSGSALGRRPQGLGRVNGAECLGCVNGAEGLGCVNGGVDSTATKHPAALRCEQATCMVRDHTTRAEAGEVVGIWILPSQRTGY